MAILSELLANLDTNFQIRGLQFEQICKWYLENDPKYRLELKKVWLWKEWPERWGPDAGIDIVAETFDKKLWAIQAKAYASNYSITKADVDTFLSESSRQVFSYRLLIATTNFIGSTAERTLRDQEKPVGKVLFFDLEKSDLDWPESPESLHAKIHEPKKPLPHQQRAISDVCKGFSDNGRGQLIMACGTGKTLVSLWVAEKLQSHRTLVLLPSLSLLAQTLREWTANASQKFHFLPVCSDDTVRGEDHLIAKTSDLGLPVTTDAKEVAAFLHQPGPIVIFSTYQSSPVIAEAFTVDNTPVFDIAIADEAHRCAGLASGSFATILDSTAIKARHRLFMTATPRYFTDRIQREADQLDFEIASMDDTSKFGKVFHLLSFSDAIKQDLLCNYRVVIIGVDDDTYRRYAEYGRFVTTDGKKITDARTLASQIAIAKAMHKYNLRRVISFHSRIKKAKDFSKELPEVINWMPDNLRPNGNFWSAHVSGEMPSGHRDALLDRFRHLGDDERGLIANARCLGEGVDIPTLDGVAFIDPRHSQVDIVQAVGRAIRKAPDKKIGTIVLPVFIEPTEDPEKALDGSAFRPVWDVLKALRAHDTALGETLDLLRTQLGQFGKTTTSFPEKLIVDLPITVGKSFAESLYIKAVERSTTSWEFFFGLLEQYIQHNGTTMIQRKYITRNGDRLGIWVAVQQQAFRKGKLSRDRQQALEQLPGWVWEHSEALWQEGFKYLREYYQQKGHTNIPKNYVTEDNYNLGTWVRRQWTAYEKGKLSLEQQQVLEQLPGWVWGPKTDPPRWQQWFDRLRQFVERNGHSSVPLNYQTEDGYFLDTWVQNQRQAYKYNRLSLERRQALEQLPGWVWTRKSKRTPDPQPKNKLTPDPQYWQRWFDRLRQFVEHEHSTNVPQKYVTEDNYNLGSWVAAQRAAYPKGKLSLERQQALEQLPGWVWAPNKRMPDQRWQEWFNRLRQFVEREHSTNVPTKYVTEDNYNLGKWVQAQRTAYKTGNLPLERQQALEQLLGWAWGNRRKSYTWNECYNYLYKYIKREGSSNVQGNYKTEEDFNLGKWVSTQRAKYNQGKLPMKEQRLLERFPEWSWRVHTATWVERFKRLCEYVKREGNARVPASYVEKDGFKLGLWVMSQREMYKHQRLSRKRQKILEQLPGWVWRPREEQKGFTKNKNWSERLKRLREYSAQNAHACVPANYVTEDGFKLGTWVRDQRYEHKKENLSKEQEQALEQLPGWVWNAIEKYGFRKNSASWMKYFERLCKYVELKGNSCVPYNYVAENGLRLGLWVVVQRTIHKKGKLSAERQKMLEGLLGWTWDPFALAWTEGLQRLQKFIEREGHTVVPTSYFTEDGFRLGCWVGAQRTAYKKGKLSLERQRSLEQLPGWKWAMRKTST